MDSTHSELTAEQTQRLFALALVLLTVRRGSPPRAVANELAKGRRGPGLACQGRRGRNWPWRGRTRAQARARGADPSHAVVRAGRKEDGGHPHGLSICRGGRVRPGRSALRAVRRLHRRCSVPRAGQDGPTVGTEPVVTFHKCRLGVVDDGPMRLSRRSAPHHHATAD